MNVVYPTIAEYVDAIREAADNLYRLKQLYPILEESALPLYFKGKSSLVFKMRDASGLLYALKCPLNVENNRFHSFKKIALAFSSIECSYLIPFEYFSNELHVSSINGTQERYPVVVRRWLEGVKLIERVRYFAHSNKSEELTLLFYRFNQFALWMKSQPYAHGGFTHDDFLVQPDGTLVLINCANMYIPSLEVVNCNLEGNINYSHPHANVSDLSIDMDDFSLVVLSISLKALSLIPSLYERFGGDDHLLFTSIDFKLPHDSNLMKELCKLTYDSEMLQLLGALMLVLANKTLPAQYLNPFQNAKLIGTINLKPVIIEKANYISQEETKPAIVPIGRSVVLDNLISNMVLIPGGSFIMGSSDEEVDRQDKEFSHEVMISPFYIGRYAVTQTEWHAVMGNNPSRFKGDGYPVEQVSWDDCQVFIQRLNAKTGLKFTLPTEAQWEYACRAESLTPYSTGMTLSSEDANYNWRYPYGEYSKAPQESPSRTTPVGAYAPNKYGLYDMHGNVWEWCQDWYDPNYYRNSPNKDPLGPTNGTTRIFRGGSWYSNARFCRSAYRSDDLPSKRSNNIGLRLACHELKV